MRFKSASSVNTDAYRAGAEIGSTLRELAPEVILLFASITYEEDFSVFYEGLYDALGSTNAIIFGGTGDGIYETNLTADYGISALGIHSEGRVTWSVSAECGTQLDSYAAARRCALALKTQETGFYFVLADGTKSDGNQIVKGVASVLPGPFFGGLTGDDRRFTRSGLFLNGRVLEDAVAILAGTGPLVYAVNAFSGWTPMGALGRVEEVKGNVIGKISGISPVAFMKEQLGKPFGEADVGRIPLAMYRPEDEGHFLLRAPSRFEQTTGAITTFGSVDEGSLVRVCSASREDVIKSVRNTIEGIGRAFTPSAAVVISCAGRKWILKDSGKEELNQIFDTLGMRVPLVGIPSFGEISPFRKLDGAYSPTFFHNVTFVICLLGG